MSVSVFEIVGPIMIGPSSSHTAGMARIGMMTHRIVGENPVDIQSKDEDNLFRTSDRCGIIWWSDRVDRK